MNFLIYSAERNVLVHVHDPDPEVFRIHRNDTYAINNGLDHRLSVVYHQNMTLRRNVTDHRLQLYRAKLDDTNFHQHRQDHHLDDHLRTEVPEAFANYHQYDMLNRRLVIDPINIDTSISIDLS